MTGTLGLAEGMTPGALAEGIALGTLGLAEGITHGTATGGVA